MGTEGRVASLKSKQKLERSSFLSLVISCFPPRTFNKFWEMLCTTDDEWSSTGL